MGMTGNYLRVSQAELNDYIRDSSKLENRVYNDNDEEDAYLINVDKAWEGIFYLLTGKSVATIDGTAETPLDWLLNAPYEIDPEQDLGYGHASYTTTAQTKELNTALDAVSEEAFKKRFDGATMTALGIYPTIWNENEEALDYLTDYFKQLKEFYRNAAASDQAVIFFIN